MNSYKLNPFIRYAKTHYALSFHEINSICYDCRLFYIELGTGQMLIENNQYEFSHDTVIFLPSGTHYNMYFNDYSKVKVLTFNFDLTDEFCEYKESLSTGNEENFDVAKFKKTSPIEMFSKPIISNNHSHLNHNLEDCINKFLTKEQFYRLSTSAILKLCLLDMAKENNADSANNAIVNKVVNYIHENYSDPELTNEIVANHFGYHPYYLGKLFKDAKGKTLHQYIATYRIRVAKDLLITTDLDINTVAWKTGFNSTSYFIKTFSQQTGITPKVYKCKNIIDVL